MPTIGQKIENNQIIIIAGVSAPGSTLPGKSYSAIVDTGAQNTMVSQKVIQAAGLPQVGHTRVMGITGVMKVAKYRARVDIPVNIGGQNVMASGKEFEVVTMPQNLGKIDVLLGMDFYQDSI